VSPRVKSIHEHVAAHATTLCVVVRRTASHTFTHIHRRSLGSTYDDAVLFPIDARGAGRFVFAVTSGEAIRFRLAAEKEK